MRIRADPGVPGHLFYRDSSPFCPISLQNLLPLEFAIGILQVLAQLCSSSANPSLGCTDFLQRNVPVSEEQCFVFSQIRFLSLSLFLSAHMWFFFASTLSEGHILGFIWSRFTALSSFPCITFHQSCLLEGELRSLSLLCAFRQEACLKLVMLLEARMLHRLKGKVIFPWRVIQRDRSCAGSTCSVQPRL